VPLLCLLAMLLAACGSQGGSAPQGGNGSTSKAPDDKQVLHYPVVGDISTVDPALVEDTDSNFPIQCIYTGLVTLDKGLNVQPQLAKSYETSSDGLTWTFKLKDNLKFSDGTPLTSTDVVYSINRAIDPATRSTVSGYLSLVKGYADFNGGKAGIKTLIGDSLLAPDPQTVVIKISKNAAYFLQTLTYPTSYVVNHALVEKYGAKFTDHLDEGAGAGPFKVSPQGYSHTTGIELVPNDNYYSAKPTLKHLSVLFYKDQTGMYKAYQAGQLDFTPVPPANLDAERQSPGFSQIPLLTIRYITMNYLIKPFDNVKIRQAMALAINKDVLAKDALNNAFTATNHFIPSGMPGYNQGLQSIDGANSTAGNADKAKQLLADGMKEAGYADVNALPPLTLTLYPRNQQFKDAVAVITQNWQQTLGLKVNVTIVDRAKLLTLTSGSKNNPQGLQMWLAGWNADYPDPQDWLSTFFENNADYNQMNYGQNQSTTADAQKAVQEKLLQADTTQDNAARMKLYNDAEQQLENDVAWIPLWQESLQILVRPTVQNLKPNSQQLIPPDDWSKIFISQ
jgi:oligopeptide transport system substrate-binding protein